MTCADRGPDLLTVTRRVDALVAHGFPAEATDSRNAAGFRHQTFTSGHRTAVLI
ncbi:hypothetical protein HEB29_000229 [Streptomyces fulvorobeus]|nr:hypothetical protein [Streptomyces fulvorobeus]